MTLDGTDLGSATADSNGAWILPLTGSVEVGAHSAQAVAQWEVVWSPLGAPVPFAVADPAELTVAFACQSTADATPTVGLFGLLLAAVLGGFRSRAEKSSGRR